MEVGEQELVSVHPRPCRKYWSWWNECSRHCLFKQASLFSGLGATQNSVAFVHILWFPNRWLLWRKWMIVEGRKRWDTSSPRFLYVVFVPQFQTCHYPWKIPGCLRWGTRMSCPRPVQPLALDHSIHLCLERPVLVENCQLDYQNCFTETHIYAFWGKEASQHISLS